MQRDIVAFHRAMNQPVGETPAIRAADLRIRLIDEEVNETIRAIERGDLVEAIDGICDALYVLIGTAVAFGVDLEPFWNEVHRTNMLKATGPVRADGKRMKPEGWKPPDIAGLLVNHRMLEVKRDAVDRAQELMTVPAGMLPPGALAVRNKFCSELGMCAEVCLTAFAAYAQVVEGLPCADVQYRVPPDGREAAWVQNALKLAVAALSLKPHSVRPGIFNPADARPDLRAFPPRPEDPTEDTRGDTETIMCGGCNGHGKDLSTGRYPEDCADCFGCGGTGLVTVPKQ